MYYKTDIERAQEKEILASEKKVAFTGTVVPEGVEADADGRKVVHRGSLIAASGKVVTVTAGDAVSFSEDPVGILLRRWMSLTEHSQGRSWWKGMSSGRGCPWVRSTLRQLGKPSGRSCPKSSSGKGKKE